jgi:lipid II:glycine glycyltransferase (peptidoglycan interpeptide bridge formation enzyme)
LRSYFPFRNVSLYLLSPQEHIRHRSVCKTLPARDFFSLPFTFILTDWSFFMCGSFAQAQPREEYLLYLADEDDHDIAYDPEPIGRYNVAPGTKILLLSERDEQLHLDPVL